MTTPPTAEITPGVAKVNWSAELAVLVPFGVVTVTSTSPADSAGEVAVMEVPELTVKAVAADEPNATAVAR